MAISKYIYSILFLFFSFSGLMAQNDSLFVKPVEKTKLKLMGFKLGVNAGRFADFLLKPERFSYEGSFDFNLGHKYFGVIEGGYSEIRLEKPNYRYFLEGKFLKAGMDYNMLKKQPTDFLGVGFRLGVSDFKHWANNVIVPSAHWPMYAIAIEPEKHRTYWLEVSLGVKGELLKNVYFGWSAMAKLHISGGKDERFQPYDIPGFGKGDSSIHLGANYYILYQIPFNRK